MWWKKSFVIGAQKRVKERGLKKKVCLIEAIWRGSHPGGEEKRTDPSFLS